VVSYNGSVLARNLEYSAGTSSVTLLLNEVLDNQLLTVTYVGINGSSSPLFTDQYLVSSEPNAGPTNTQTSSDKVFFNTDQGKFEFYLESEPQTTDISLSLNGSLLSNGIEYFRSKTNNRRVILEIDIEEGDILQAFYLPKTGLLGGIDTNTPIFTWSIANAPIPPISGEFTLEIADFSDEDFNTILYSGSADYINDVNTYTSQINLSGATAGDQFRYRIKNKKKYEPISGETITDIVYSDVNTFELISNQGNSY
jgi:hypothetical protein